MDDWIAASFDKRVGELNLQASVGKCALSKYGSTIGNALGFDGIKFCPERLNLFKIVVRDRIHSLIDGPGDADDIYCFVKQEPHKTKKLEEGRYRLISAVSMVDTMVDRMVFGDLADKVLKSVGSTPIMIGWTPLQGGYRLLRDLLPGKVLCVDKSSWDWTVPFWMTECWLDIVLQLCNQSPPFWERLVRQRFRMLFQDAVFQFSDGTRVRQEVPGVMKSGCFLTIILNSVGQLLLHYMICEDLGIEPEGCVPYCMGDDTAQMTMSPMCDYIERFGYYGFKVKEAKVLDWIEFAGFMVDDKTWPVYWQKHLFNLQHADPKLLPEMLEGYQMLYAQEPAMLDFVQNIMIKICPSKVLPRDVLQGFVKGVPIGLRHFRNLQPW